MCKFLVAFLSAFLIGSPTVLATTIAWDGSSIASDSQMTVGTMKQDSGPKIYYFPRLNIYLGLAGSLEDIQSLVRHFDTGEPLPPEYSGQVEGILITASDHKAYMILRDEKHLKEVKAPFAVGSGAPCAISAMLTNASAAEAVAIAEKIDLYSSGKIWVFVIGEHNIKSFESTFK